MSTKKEIVKDLLFKGFVERTEDLEGIPIVLRNLNSNDQLEIEMDMGSVKGSSAVLIHTYQIMVMHRTLVSVGDIKFETRADAQKWQIGQSSTILNFIIKKQNALEKELAVLVGAMDEEKLGDFTETPESTED